MIASTCVPYEPMSVHYFISLGNKGTKLFRHLIQDFLLNWILSNSYFSHYCIESFD